MLIYNLYRNTELHNKISQLTNESTKLNTDILEKDIIEELCLITYNFMFDQKVNRQYSKNSNRITYN